MEDPQITREILERDCDTWCGKIIAGASKIDRIPESIPFESSERSYIGPHVRSLLSELLYISGGTITGSHIRYSPTSSNFTPSDNLTLYGLALDAPTSCPPRFPVREAPQIRDALLRSGLAGTEQVKSVTEHQVSEWVEQLKRSLPITSPDLVYMLGPALYE